MAALSQFVPNGSTQDNQWADPTLASPLAALSHYLSGISAVGLNGDGTSGGAEGGNGASPWGELYSTSAYDPNTSNYDSANQSLQSALAAAQKYDPNAHLTYYDPTSGSEGGSSTPMVRIDMDQSKLPTAPTIQGGVQLLSNVRTANNQTPDAGQGPQLYNQSAVFTDPNWGPYTTRLNVKQPADKLTDVGFWGPAVVAAITGGAGMGMLPGFGGMSAADSLGTLAGTLGETGAGASAPVTSILGMSPNKFANSFQTVGNQALSGKPNVSSLANIGASALGVPSSLSSLANLAMTLSQGGKINPLTILSLLGKLPRGAGSGGA